MWQTTTIESTISPAENTPKARDTALTAATQAGSGRMAYLTLSAFSISSLPPGTFSANCL
jgi:hypothetical protein